MRHDPLAHNPFHLLAVAPTASRTEVERQGQKLLGLLELGLQQAALAPTPLGPRERRADDVRWALAELRDPDRRLAHELWAALAPGQVRPPPAAPLDPALAPWPEAPLVLGERPRLTVDLFALFALLGAAIGLRPTQLVEHSGQGTLAWAGVWVLFIALTPWLLWQLVSRASPQVVHRLGMAAGHEGHDGPGLAALAAAQVCLARGGSEAERAWVEQRLEAARPLRAAGLVAAALLLERRDPDGAIGLLQSVEQLRVAGAPAVAFRVARERRALDAVARGDWAALESIAALPGRRHTSRLTRLLGAIARRLRQRPDAPTDHQLRRLWLLAPRRAVTSPLLARALARPPVSLASLDSSTGTSLGPLPADPWTHALARLAYARLGQPSGAELSALGAACDDALASLELSAVIEQRARELGSSLAPRMLGQLRDEVADELARAAAAGDWPIGSLDAPGLTLERATRRLRDTLLAELEAACDATRRRALAERALPTVDEWREALALRHAHERLARLAGPMARRLAWPRVRDDLGKLAVWLWNRRSEKTIAHALFAWLLAEATALDDQEAVVLQRKNVDCGF